MNREMEIEKGWVKDDINNIFRCQLIIMNIPGVFKPAICWDFKSGFCFPFW